MPRSFDAIRQSVGEMFTKSPGPAMVLGAAKLGATVQDLYRRVTTKPTPNRKPTARSVTRKR